MTINFLDLDFSQRIQDSIAIWENETGLKLETFDQERLLIHIINAVVQQAAINFNQNALQTLLPYMNNEQLDAYGKHFGVTRLDSVPSKAIVRFTFTQPQLINTFIYENTVVSGANDNGTYTFKVPKNTFVALGTSYIDIEVEEFLEAGGNSGSLANEIAVGDIDSLDGGTGDLTFIDTVANINVSSGGADEESNELYRSRLYLAPFKFSTAGAKNAYIYWAKTASPDVADANLKKDGFNINIYILPKDFDGSFQEIIVGDTGTQIANLVLSGLSLSNSDRGILYWNVQDIAGTKYFQVYKDSGKAAVDMVAVGTGTGAGLVLSAVGASGLTGVYDLTYSGDDTDASNTITSNMATVGAVDYIFNVNDDIRPLNDIVTIFLAEQIAFTISNIDITVYDGYSTDSVRTDARSILDTFIANQKVKLGIDVVKSQLISFLSNIDGVKQVDVTFNSDSTVDLIEIDENQVATGSYSSSDIVITGGALI